MYHGELGRPVAVVEHIFCPINSCIQKPRRVTRRWQRRVYDMGAFVGSYIGEIPDKRPESIYIGDRPEIEILVVFKTSSLGVVNKVEEACGS